MPYFNDKQMEEEKERNEHLPYRYCCIAYYVPFLYILSLDK